MKSKIKIINKIFLVIASIEIIFILFFSVSLIRNSNSSPDQLKELININTDIILDNYFRYKINRQAGESFELMTSEEKVGQLMFITLPSGYVNNETLGLLEKIQPGGIVLMSYNIINKDQLIKFNADINSNSKIKPFIAVDQEGGLVARIPWDTARYISQPHLGIVNREDFAYETTVEHASALLNLNINTNLAPVVDISFSGTSAMASRTLGSTPSQVANLSEQIVIAYHDNNILATAKHFPGIGRSSTDSHNKLPIIDISKEILTNEELVPFITTFSQNVDFVMTGHALYPQIDPDYPASLSKIFITDILKNELKYNGIIISDDLNMKALSNYENPEITAINSGTDMIMFVSNADYISNKFEYLVNAYNDGTLNKDEVDESVKKVLRTKFEKS